MQINFKRIGVVAGAIAGVLTAILTWQQLGWPLPASAESVANVKAFAITSDEKVEVRIAAQDTYSKETRSLLLSDKWFRIDAELKDARRRLERDPNNDDLRFAIQLLEQQKKTIQEQMNQLK